MPIRGVYDTNKTEISVIVPVYNSARYIRRCIDSILCQTYSEFEIILVDDGSSDKGGKICDEYASNYDNVQVIHKENGGLGSARVAGINAAQGKYISFVDSDDWIDSDVFEHMVNMVNSNSSPDILIGCYVIDEKDTSKFLFSDMGDTTIDSTVAIGKMFEGKYYNWSLCDKLYKRKLLYDSGVVEKWPRGYGEDTYANWRLFSAAGNIVYKYICGYHYVMHNTSMTHNEINHNKFDYFSIYQMIVDEMIERKELNNLSVLISVAFSVCVPIIYAAQKEYSEFELEITKGIDKLKSFLKIAKSYNSPIARQSLLKQFSLINHSRIEIEEIVRNRNDEIQKFCECSIVFMYGAGKIAREVLNILKDLEIEVTGIIITKSSGDSDYMGIPLLDIGTFIDMKINAKVILAMNEKNSKEVLRASGINKLYEVLDIGKYCIDYY